MRALINWFPLLLKRKLFQLTSGKRKPTGKDTIVLPADLPTERKVIDLPESAKVCPETGIPLVKIGEEITSKLAHKPGSYYIKQIVRPKYANPQKSEDGVFTADLPESLLTRCQADESLLADILVKKFADHLPLYRQSEIMNREGIYISRQTLCQWVLRAGMALKPLYNEMVGQILKSGNIFYDETPIQMLAPGKGKRTKPICGFWLEVNHPILAIGSTIFRSIAVITMQQKCLRVIMECSIPISMEPMKLLRIEKS